MTRISIVIPAYNNAHLIGRCIESVVAQSSIDWEAIIVNDASTDDTSEVAHAQAAKDARFTVIDKPQNEGLHLARRTGTLSAAGEYVMYLDADDELAGPDVLRALIAELDRDAVDILRFGLKAVAEGGMADSAVQGFNAWSNGDVGQQSIEETRRLVFSATGKWVIPWHVTHRLFRTDMAKRAFAIMTDQRLERAEDAYEYLVFSCFAQNERACCDIEGYLYHMGVGVTNARSLSAERFAKEARDMWRCAEEALAFTHICPLEDVRDCAYGLKVKLLEAMGNDLNERVVEAERPTAERLFAEIVGDDCAACEFWRFVRDKSWRYLVDDVVPQGDDELFRLLDVAEQATDRADNPREDMRCARIRRDAHTYLDRIEVLRQRESGHRAIRILASTHWGTEPFDSEIIDLIQVGAENAPYRLWHTLHDDSGDNISALNAQYCELTAQYWAWKNLEADYYGFCHYRRYFNFSDVRYPENSWGEVFETSIDAETQVKYGLTDDAIRKALAGYDVVTTEFKDLRLFPDKASTPYEQWCWAENLHENDLVRMMDIVVANHPEYERDVRDFLRGSRSCFCNMYVMRKDIFFDYCAWLFPLLEQFCSTADFSRYSRERLRTPGHLAERLFNIYFKHQMRTGSSWKVKNVQCVHFLEPGMRVSESSMSLAASATEKTVVPVVFAADDAYAPMLTTTIYSMLKNARTDAFFDITVLSSGISPDNQRTMREFLTRNWPAELTFMDARSLLRNYDLTTSNEHISVETYYRFLIQDVLPHYDKVVYLDSDLIIQGDVTELIQVDLGDNLIAAVRDVDYLGNLNIGTERYEYSKSVLRMNDPYDYFQAGVLVLNTAALREAVPLETWLTLAQNRAFIYDDQDILNACCEGRVTFLDAAWNVMHNGSDRIALVCSRAPVDVFDDYMKARQNEKVIHYAGIDKPWSKLMCDRAQEYWAYARETPFYEQLIARLSASYTKYLAENPEDLPVIGEQNPLRRVLDPIMPYGSRRREFARSIGKIVRGMN